MSHVAICTVCLDGAGRPRRWRESCEECTRDIAAKHRGETGHDVELRLVAEPTIANLQKDMRTANLIARRNGW